jgi:hypothetical protein
MYYRWFVSTMVIFASCSAVGAQEALRTAKLFQDVRIFNSDPWPLRGAQAAAMQSPQIVLPVGGGSNSSVLQVADDGRCRNWRRECIRRWGTASWKFKRCMREHGCDD